MCRETMENSKAAMERLFISWTSDGISMLFIIKLVGTLHPESTFLEKT
jgi:hypothetical protein